MHKKQLKESLFTHENHPLLALAEMIETNKHRPVTIRPSGIVEFLDNSLSWATKQLLGVNFGGSEATVLGTAVHASAEYGYKSILAGENLPSIEECGLAIEASIEAEYGWIDNPEMTKEEMITEAKRLFAVYYSDVMPNANPVAAEERFVLEGWDGIELAGTTDRIERRLDGKLAITDLKTSKQNIYGKRAYGMDALDVLRAKFKELSKLSEKNAPKAEEIKEAQKVVKEIQRKLGLKKTTNEERIELEAQLKYADAIVYAFLEEVNMWMDGVNIERDELQAKINQIAPAIEQQQYQNDCIAAMHKHGLQLASYAFLYEAATGTEINWGRIEVIVKYNPIPIVRILEFPLTAYKRECALAVDLMVETIQALRSGTPARILFRLNPETFRGSELTDMVRELSMNV